MRRHVSDSSEALLVECDSGAEELQDELTGKSPSTDAQTLWSTVEAVSQSRANEQQTFGEELSRMLSASLATLTETDAAEKTENVAETGEDVAESGQSTLDAQETPVKVRESDAADATSGAAVDGQWFLVFLAARNFGQG